MTRTFNCIASLQMHCLSKNDERACHLSGSLRGLPVDVPRGREPSADGLCFQICYRHTLKTGEMRNMKQNPVAEHCKQCGSSNVSLVHLRISPWEVLAMVPRSLGLLSPAFFSLLARGNPKQSRQDQQYRCLKCNRMWHVRRETTAM